MMLADSLIVSHNIIPCPGESAGIFAACSATRIDRRANLGVGIIQRIVIYQVEVEAGLEFQPSWKVTSRKVRPENSSRIRSDLSLGKVAGRFQLAVAPDGR